MVPEKIYHVSPSVSSHRAGSEQQMKDHVEWRKVQPFHAQFSSLLHLNWCYFVSVYPPPNISPKMGLCMSHPKPNQKLCAAPHEYSVLFSPKRNQFWCKYFTWYVLKTQCFLEPWKGSAGLPGSRLYNSKMLQQHLLSSPQKLCVWSYLRWHIQNEF